MVIEMIKTTYTQKIVACAMTVAAAMGLASCSDSYPGLEYNGDNTVIQNNESYDKTPIMVFINPQNFFSITATRSGGTGPFTDLSNKKYEKSIFYVFAFRGTKDEPGHGSLSYEPDLSKTRFTENLPHDDEADNCLVDGKDYDFGYPAKLTRDYPGAFDFKDKDYVSGDLQDKDDPGEDGALSAQLYYSTLHQDVGYNFFAYHIDNLDETAVSNRRQNTSEIAYDLTIDGTQDIMCGYAPALTSDVLDPQNLRMSPEERQNILNIGLYSTFAAHRGVNPTVNLVHQLTRLDFEAYPGDKEAGKITIEKISVLERTHGRLVVAHKDVHKDGSLIGYMPYDEPKEPIYLKGEPDNEGNECPDFEPIKVEWQDGDEYKLVYERTRKEVGGSLMLPEADSYEITLEFTQEGVLDTDGQPKHLYATYNVVRPKKEIFQRGYNYTISIAVYGLEPIKVTANIANWKDGGDIKVDEDDPADGVEIHD